LIQDASAKEYRDIALFMAHSEQFEGKRIVPIPGPRHWRLLSRVLRCDFPDQPLDSPSNPSSRRHPLC